MHWLLLAANTLTGEPVTLSAHETEADCKAAQAEVGSLIARQQNQSLDLNSSDGPWLSCKSTAEPEQLP
jgi:hypothetical protein